MKLTMAKFRDIAYLHRREMISYSRMIELINEVVGLVPPVKYTTVLIMNEQPPLGKWVTTIDIDGEHRVYRRTELGWNMRDADTQQSPKNDLPIIYWLKEERLNTEQ